MVLIARALMAVAACQAEWRQPVLGLCENYPEDARTLRRAREDFELMKRAGVAHLRVTLGWDACEAAKDRYDFAFWDEFIRAARVEYGLQLLVSICYTPRWNSARGDAGESWRLPPRDYEEFAQFVGDVVKRYRSFVRAWEIWNEPDNPAFWKGTIDEYARLLHAGARAVRDADPQATVVLGGIARDEGYLLRLFRDHRAAAAVDVVSVHAYFETWNGGPLEDLVRLIEDAQDVIRRYGSGEAIWVGESAYSSYRRGAAVSEHYVAGYAYEHTPEFQAQALLRTTALALSTNAVGVIDWCRIRDARGSEGPSGDPNYGHLGVVAAGGEAKPAYQALLFAESLFDRPLRCVDRELVARRPLRSESEVHAFAHRDGTLVVVGWLRTGTAARPLGGEARDARREEIRLQLPRVSADRCLVYDELGRLRGTVPVTPEGELDVALRGGETRVFVLRAAR